MTGDKNKTQNNNPADKNTDQKSETNKDAKPSPVVEKATEKKPVKKTAANKKGGSLLVLILLFIILAALTVGGYFAWQYWNEYSSKQEQRIQALESVTAKQSSQVETLSAQQNEQSQDQGELFNAIKSSQEAIQQRLDSHTQRIRALAGTSRDDWLLAEARYLLRLANQRLLVERGTDGARALLESADNILQSVDDSGVMPVRSAIANEVIALKLAKTVDRQGLYLRLSALKQQIQALPLIPFRTQDNEQSIGTADDTSTTLETNEDNPWYYAIWNSIEHTFGNLDRFVQIRDHDEAPELLISEAQQLQTINHLMLMFEQAQFALLHEEEMIYRNSLEEAINWWTNYYSHYNEYEVLRSEMRELQHVNVIQVLPDISRSSELLTDYIERFHKLNTAEASNTSTAPTPAPEPKTNTEVTTDTIPANADSPVEEPQS